MKPVFQEYYELEKSDCLRASVASIFELDISQVPNFFMFPEKVWVGVYSAFIWSIGYEWQGTGSPDSHELNECESINGYHLACVPSKNIKDSTHSVIIDESGLVVHDPHNGQDWKNKRTGTTVAIDKTLNSYLAPLNSYLAHDFY